jgi:uncharacterized protein YjdB
MMKKIMQTMLAILIMFTFVLPNGWTVVQAAGTTPSVKYSVHVQDKGWMDEVSNGTTGGTTGQALQAEAIKIQISGASGGIAYRTYVQNKGWTSWSSNNRMSGTTGKGLRMEAIQVKLTGTIASNYDVYYRVHLADVGWLGWTKNGQTAGSTGCGIQMEAIQIQLYPKNQGITTSKSYISKPQLKVRAHVQDIGWQSSVGESKTAGTTGKGYRLEGLIIQCSDFLGGNGIQYRAHVQDEGWQGWKTSGQTAGTVGKAKRMEAVEIKLSGTLASYFDVYYRVHCEDYGWLGWASNGESAGTVGGAKRIEAIQIKLALKTESVDKGGTAFYDLSGSSSGSGTSDNSSFQWPLTNSYVCGNKWSQYYSVNGKDHLGMDINSSSGDTQIYATGDGTVAQTGWNSANGYTITIKHTISGKTVYSFYAHLSSVNVSKGDSISKGQNIGVIGNTGSSSTGTHLHFAFTTQCSAGTWGYGTSFSDSSNVAVYQGYRFYNPTYIINNGKLP